MTALPHRWREGEVWPWNQGGEGRQTEREPAPAQHESRDVEGRGSNTLGKGRKAQEDFWEVAERQCDGTLSRCSTKLSVKAMQFADTLVITFVLLVLVYMPIGQNW